MAISEISDIVRKTLKEESGDSDLTAALKMLVGSTLTNLAASRM